MEDQTAAPTVTITPAPAQGDLGLTSPTADEAAKTTEPHQHPPVEADAAPSVAPTPPAPTAEPLAGEGEASNAANPTVETPQTPQPEPAASAPEGAGDLPDDPAKPDLKIVERKKSAAELLERLNELEGRLAHSEKREADAKARERERMEEERADLLVNRWKLRKDIYAQLAPTVEDADPTTAEGKEILRQWACENRALFEAAPELPKGDVDGIKSARFGQQRRWRDIWGK